MRKVNIKEIWKDTRKRAIILLFGALCLYTIITITEYFVYMRVNLIGVELGSMSTLVQVMVTCLGIFLFFTWILRKSDGHSQGDERLEYLIIFLISTLVILLGAFYFASSIDRYPFPSKVQFSYKYLILLIGVFLVKIGVGLGFRWANKGINRKIMKMFEIMNYVLAGISLLNVISYSIANTLKIGMDAVITTVGGVIIITFGIFVLQNAIRLIIKNPPKEKLGGGKEKVSSPRVEGTGCKKTWRKVLNGVIAIVILLVMVLSVAGVTGMIGYSVNRNIVLDRLPVEYENQLVPTLDEKGVYTFVTDDEFRVMQITDVHIGAGFMTIQKDKWALNAVATMVTAEKPDLVILTGDIAYPFGFQTGSFNNLKQIKIVSELMEELEVYWTIIFGNHDAVFPCTHSKQSICDYLVNSDLKYCLFQEGPEDIDGKGNHYIAVKNTQGLTTNAFVMLDSHAYRKEGGYDNIKQNQVDWYEKTINDINIYNAQILDNIDTSLLPHDESVYRNVNSLIFIHIPLREYEVAWNRYSTEGNSEEIEYIYGVMRAPMKPVNCGAGEDELFETALALGSTSGIFCGHDHLNNFQIAYKGIRLTYALSIDYTAFTGIDKQGAQRGCTLIYCKTDGTWESENSNYYQIKYDSPGRTENVHFN